MALKKYGDFEELSKLITDDLSYIISKLEKESSDISIYFGYPIIDRKDSKDYIKGLIVCESAVIVMYEHDTEKNLFASHIMQTLMEIPELFGKLYTNATDDERILKTVGFEDKEDIFRIINEGKVLLTNGEIREINNAIQNAYGLSKEDNRSLTDGDSVGARIKKRNNFVATFDEEQFNAIHSLNNKNIRIRGLAGSGKTIILVKKMAYLHYKNRNQEMAYVFFTVSLKQYITNLFKKFYKDYDKHNQPDMSKIHIVHAWGGKARAGFYSSLCENNKIEPVTYGAVKYKDNPFEYICADLDNKTLNQDISFYDYVLVDEAQDFGINFFKLARRSLKEYGKLIYAYDELQSLTEESSIPSKSEIFGDDECVDINLKISYRTPVEILVTAHAIGLGIYREVKPDENPVVNIIEDVDTWTAIGYETSDGTSLVPGEYVKLKRNEPLMQNSNELIITEKFRDEQEQFKKIAQTIIELIRHEDVLPEDILIIDMASSDVKDNFEKFRKIFFDESHVVYDTIDKIKIVNSNVNLVDKNDPISFRKKDSIPYTTIYRAKGNEANIVFVINSHVMSSAKSVTRNSIFTAATRARYSVYITGLEEIETYIKEVEKTKNNNFTLCFTYPTEEEMKKIRIMATKENEAIGSYYDTKNTFKKVIETNKDLAFDLLKDLLKDLPDQQRIDLLKKIGDSNNES